MDTLELERRLKEWVAMLNYSSKTPTGELIREAADALAAQRERIAVLEGALNGLVNMYANTWDRVDGALVMMDTGVERFEKAHEAARAALKP